MDIEVSDTVATTADPALLWQRMLEPSAVTGFVSGGVIEADPADPDASSPADAPLAEGHTFRIRVSGQGGGLVHGRIDMLAEHEVVSYTLWREDLDHSSILLTYHIDTTGPQTMLAGTISMFMPLDTLLAPGSIAGRLLRPAVGWLVRRHAGRRLRAQLLQMTGNTTNGKPTP